MARPAKLENESVRRGVNIRMRISRELYEQIVRAAAGEAISVPAWIVSQCLDGLDVLRHHRALSGGKAHRGSAAPNGGKS